MKIFESVAKTFISISILVLLLASFFFVKDYISKIKDYNEYKQKVEKTLKDNKVLTNNINDLQSKQAIYDKEREDFLLKIKLQDELIAKKEAIIIANGQVIIPSDYENLKSNYLTLFDLYADCKKSKVLLQIQVEKDAKQITDLSKALEDAKNNIAINTQIIEKEVIKPVPFYKSSILIGGGVDSNNSKSVTFAYQGIIKDKLIVQGQVTYPPRLTALIGIKL